MALSATTRRFSFRSVHSLNDEKIHGHQYFAEISFYGCEREPIERAMSENVLPFLDGRDLTQLMPVATGENLVEWIHGRLLESALPGKILGVALQETRKNRFLSARSDVRLI